MPPPADILIIDTPAAFDSALQRAVELLEKGEVVALPTETVYGLAANAWNPSAVARIYEVKGRPAHNPIIVHVSDPGMARQCAATWPQAADQLARAFWPGPLTIVVQKSRLIPSIVTAGGDTVGIRWPSHPFIQAVIQRTGFPLAAPSANPANAISPTTAQHVAKSLGAKIPLIVDGGASGVGIESTVVDLSISPARLLRPGMIHAESLLSVLGNLETQGGKTPVLRSPGQLPKHYAPQGILQILEWPDEPTLEARLKPLRARFRKIHILAHTRIPLTLTRETISVIPHDPEAFARALYAELHRCDEEQAELILVEKVPDLPEWSGVADRLKRAASTEGIL